MSNTTNTNKKMIVEQVVVFPFLAKGHTIPLLHLATALSSRNILVNFITTPAALPFLRHHLSTITTTTTSPEHFIHFHVLPFPSHPDLPPGVETTDSLPSFSLFPAFLAATTSLQHPFATLLHRLITTTTSSDYDHHHTTPPLCLISDFFLGWTLPICRRFGIPRLVFHGMSVFSMSICKSLWNNSAAFSAAIDEPITVPGAPPSLRLNVAEIPEPVRNSVDQHAPATEFLNTAGEADVASYGVIVNSFAALEPPVYVDLLESFYRQVAGGRCWLVGPLSLLSSSDRIMNGYDQSPECIRWLDRQPDGSVIYVAFGTQATVSGEQLDEVAYGLVKAGVRFLWAVRSETWVAPVDVGGELGRIERGWVPQKEVLNHVAVGGFLSHCGWNSVMEAVAAGVAVLAFPMIAEQHLNAKMVEEVIGVGMRVKYSACSSSLVVSMVGREEVEEGVRELMMMAAGVRGEMKGRMAREKAVEMGKKAREAVEEGGSSYEALEDLLYQLRKLPKAADQVVVVHGSDVGGGDD